MIPAMILGQVSEEAGKAAVDAVKSMIEGYAAGGGFGWQILLIVLTVVGTPLGALLFFYINKLWAKTGIELSGTILKFARDQADSVIDQVEAWANKKTLEGQKRDSDSKLKKGLELLGGILEASGVAKKLEGKLEHILEERLMARGIVKTESSDPS